MDKKRMTKLMSYADTALTESGIRTVGSTAINDSFNGQTAAFGVTIAMSGLIPALAIYYQQASETREIDRRQILDAIGRMIAKDQFRISQKAEDNIHDAKSLIRIAIKYSTDKDKVKSLKREVIDCAIALKQVIRTYNLN